MARPPDTLLAVVIVTHNSETVIEGCLSSVQAAAADRLPRVVVVDNRSTDGTLDVVQRLFPWVEVLQAGRNGGYASAINLAGRALADDAPVLVLNPDVRMSRGSIDSLLRRLDDPHVGVVAPKLLTVDSRLQYSIRRDPGVLRALGETLLGGTRAGRYPLLGEVESRAFCYETAHPVDWATGAALVISPRCRSQVGDWDETFFLYGEETDFCQRARAAGWLVMYEPSASAVHIGGELSQSTFLRAVLLRSKLLLSSRTSGRLGRWALWAVLLLNEASRALRGSPPHRAGLRYLLGGRLRLPKDD